MKKFDKIISTFSFVILGIFAARIFAAVITRQQDAFDSFDSALTYIAFHGFVLTILVATKTIIPPFQRMLVKRNSSLSSTN